MKNYFITLSIFLNVLFFGWIIRRVFFPPPGPIYDPAAHFSNRDKIIDLLPKDKSDIIFFGDSQFQNYNVEEYYKTLTVKNRGIFFESALGLQNRSGNISEGKPAKVFIEIGVNDLENERKLSDIQSNVLKTILTIKTKSPETKIYLLSIFPTSILFGNDSHSIEPERRLLNTFYAQIARTNNFTFINLDPFFLDNGLKQKYDCGDKLHLNAAGYFELTQILKPYIN